MAKDHGGQHHLSLMAHDARWRDLLVQMPNGHSFNEDANEYHNLRASLLLPLGHPFVELNKRSMNLYWLITPLLSQKPFAVL